MSPHELNQRSRVMMDSLMRIGSHLRCSFSVGLISLVLFLTLFSLVQAFRSLSLVCTVWSRSYCRYVSEIVVRSVVLFFWWMKVNLRSKLGSQIEGKWMDDEIWFWLGFSWVWMMSEKMDDCRGGFDRWWWWWWWVWSKRERDKFEVWV